MTNPCTVIELINSPANDNRSIRYPAAMTIVRTAEDLPAEFPNDAPFALLTVQSPDRFTPSTDREGLPSCLQGFSPELGEVVTKAINGSDWSNQRQRRAVTTLSGGVIVLRNVGGKRRRIYPDALPAECEPLYVTSVEQARDLAAERNAPRFAMARAPREWTVAVKNPRFGRVPNEFEALCNVERNPLAEKLVDLYLPVWERIESDLPAGVSVGGAKAVQTGDDGKPYALDDERLYAEAEIRIDHTLLYDLRGDIEGNVAKALREYAHELLDAANGLTAGKVPAESVETPGAE